MIGELDLGFDSIPNLIGTSSTVTLTKPECLILTYTILTPIKEETEAPDYSIPGDPSLLVVYPTLTRKVICRPRTERKREERVREG